MEAKFFGNFLVERGLITTDQLVQALIEQARALPPVFQIVYERGHLPTDQWLKVFELQVREHIDFAVACQRLGLWTPELASVVQAELQRTRIPLGHLLLKAKAIDLSNLTKALDEYLSRIEIAPAIPVAAVATAAASTPMPVAASEMDEKPVPAEIFEEPAMVAAPVTAAAIRKIDGELMKDFAEFFTVERLSGLTNLVDMVTSDFVDQAVVGLLLSDCRVELHTLRGVAVCLRLNETTKLLTTFEALVAPEHDVKYVNASHKEHVRDKATALASLLTELRGAVIDNQTEEVFVQSNQERVQSVLNAA